MIDKENKTFEETIVAGNMEEAKKTAQESNPEAKIVSANWVYKWLIFTLYPFPVFAWKNVPRGQIGGQISVHHLIILSATIEREYGNVYF